MIPDAAVDAAGGAVAPAVLLIAADDVAAPSPFRSVLLAAIQGSTSLLGYTVPGCAATVSAVQPANGVAPDTSCSTPTLDVEAHAVPQRQAGSSNRHQQRGPVPSRHFPPPQGQIGCDHPGAGTSMLKIILHSEAAETVAPPILHPSPRTAEMARGMPQAVISGVRAPGGWPARSW